MGASLALGMCAACGDGRGEPETRGVTKLSDAPKTGLVPGIVTGRIYDDLDQNAGARMSDLRDLGVKILRIEIEGTDYAKYRRIVRAANRYGIDVLALVSSAANAHNGHPVSGGDFNWFHDHYVPSYIATVQNMLDAIPEVRFIEVFNEPDVYDFKYLEGENARRYALIATRVYEHFHERNADRPKLVAFDFSRHDDGKLRDVVFNDVSITNHRKGYRPGRGLPDGLPADIVSIHGYGNSLTHAPDEDGYTYDGKTFEGGVQQFLDARFRETVNGNDRAVNQTPVWYTEVGWEWDRFGEEKQAELVRYAFDTLRKYPQVTAAFWYDYRDDDGGKGENAGLRSGVGDDDHEHACGVVKTYREHPSWRAYQQAAGGSTRVTFADTPKSNPLHGAVEALFAHGITTGYDADHFGPEDLVTKTQIDVFMARAEGKPTGSPAESPAATRADMVRALAPVVKNRPPYHGYFADIGEGHELAAEIEGLYEAGVAKGFDAGNGRVEFRPDDSLTRAQMSAFICRAYGIR